MKKNTHSHSKQQELSASILASLENHLAVLDNTGKIVAVNDAWIKYGLNNGAQSTDPIGVGVNYLNTCRPAAEARPRRSTQGY